MQRSEREGSGDGFSWGWAAARSHQVARGQQDSSAAAGGHGPQSSPERPRTTRAAPAVTWATAAGNAGRKANGDGGVHPKSNLLPTQLRVGTGALPAVKAKLASL